MRWRIVAHPEVLGTHQWSVYAGLAGLVRSGEATVTWKVLRPATARAAFLIQVTDTLSNDARVVAFEMHDGADLNPWHAAHADVLFKRSFDMDRHDGEYAHALASVHPMGLTIGCTAPGLPKLVTHSVVALAAAVLSHKSDVPSRQVLSMLRSVCDDGVASFLPRRSAKVPEPISLYESFQGRQIDEPYVTFLVRAWDHRRLKEPSRSGFAEVTAGRARLIRLLRSELGPRFVGGFISDEFARSAFPDCVTHVSTRRRDFVATVANGGIAVSTVGLDDSNPWKLAEYLASGAAIVTEPLRRDLPEPLIRGRDYLEFITPDQCVAQCRDLLSDPARLLSMRRSAADFWNSFVRPDQLLRRRLDEAFAM